MTEGSIAAWRVKEGDKYAVGDVLLEIETDKATMDVEAQDDGIMMKIMQGDGTKAVQVGSRIGVIAESGDDISTLEIPKDAATKPTAPKEAAPTPSPASQEQPSAPAPGKNTTTGKPQKQKYPLLPSVMHLAHENGLDDATVNQIVPTGPNGRLLKGDVLAYLGRINAATPADISSRFEHASHLDLSNIKVAKAPEPKKAAKPEVAAPVVENSLISLPVSLAAVVSVQQKIHDTLGVFLPLSELVARAADLANDELPLPAGAQPTADELFNQVLGLDTAGSRESRGSYVPQVSALAPASLLAPRVATKKLDVIDILAGSSRAAAPKRRGLALPGVSSEHNLYSLVVPKAEERRARVFLERFKLVLEKDPGRLVL